MNRLRQSLVLLACCAAPLCFGQLARIEITPSNPTLQVGDTTTFSAKGFDAQGDETAITDPNWQGDGKNGSIAVNPTNAQQCTYTATNRGNGSVTCYDGDPAGGGQSGSAALVVKCGTFQPSACAD